MADDGAILVVGADGGLGGRVAARLSAGGMRVISTSRRGTPGTWPLDLSSSAPWRLPSGLATAVLAAAVTSTEACRRQPAVARRVNVEASVTLVRTLVSMGTRVVFLSSNLVFDGSIPYTPAATPTCPRTAYGAMKATAERALLGLSDRVAVVRLTKVLDASTPLVAAWRRSLGRGEPVRPLVDMVLAPVAPDFAARAIAAVACSSASGILQVSAATDITYAAVAARLADAWGFAGDLVNPVTVADAGLDLEHLPRHTTLDATRLESMFGIQPPDPWDAVAAAGQQ